MEKTTAKDYRDLVNPPYFISYAGVDDQTNIDTLIRLYMKWNPYYGILMSPKKRGVPRYPSINWIVDFLSARKEVTDKFDNGELPDASAPDVCIHLCGDYIEAMEEDGFVGIEHLFERFPNAITRVQFNLAGKPLSEELSENIWEWSRNYGVTPIIQVRDFPLDDKFTYLLDRSEGKGITPKKWPTPKLEGEKNWGFLERGNYPGYAGGINLSNVYEVVSKIGEFESTYFLDLESGARDSFNQFDTTVIERIGEKIYGPRLEYWYEETPPDPEEQVLDEDDNLVDDDEIPF